MFLKFSKFSFRVIKLGIYCLIFLLSSLWHLTAQNDGEAKEVSAVNSNFSDTAVSFYKVDEVPTWGRCGKRKTEEKRQTCTGDKLMSYINRKLNTSVVKKNGPAVVQVDFIIDREGKATGIKATSNYPELVEEVENLIAGLPKMQPGKHQGEIVPVSFHFRTTVVIDN